ncbi:MAG TPA: Rab family GTPase [Thermoplasmata archaeon]|jgi:small GTP-binding protein|nr:Rab family GTPase [Thermoplasmata archaeon]
MQASPAQPLKHVKAKVCLVGDVAVGKTSLIKRFVQDNFDDRYVATVGTKVTKKTVNVQWKGVPATLDLMVWDIMGEKGFRTLLRDAYFEGAQGVLAVCDLTRKETFYDLSNWVTMVKKQVGEVPIVFLGNKSDLAERLVVSEDELGRMGVIHQAGTHRVSAKTGTGVQDAFQDLADAIGKRGES